MLLKEMKDLFVTFLHHVKNTFTIASEMLGRFVSPLNGVMCHVMHINYFIFQRKYFKLGDCVFSSIILIRITL